MLNQPSQTRSGLAQNALQRSAYSMLHGGQKPAVNKPRQAGPKAKPNFFEHMFDQAVKFQKKQQAPAKKPLPNSAKPQPGSNSYTLPQTPAQPAWTPPNYVKINSNGQLDLPYSEQFGMDMLNTQQNMNSQLLDLNAQQQNQAMEYMNAKRQAQQDYQDAGRQTLNNDAARGMAFSSGYGKHVADNARNYDQYMGSLEGQNSAFLGQVAQQRQGIETGYNDFLRRAAYQRAMELSGDAGTLGFGQSKPSATYSGSAKLPKINTSKPKPSSKPKAESKPKAGAKHTSTKRKPGTLANKVHKLEDRVQKHNAKPLRNPKAQAKPTKKRTVYGR